MRRTSFISQPTSAERLNAIRKTLRDKGSTFRFLYILVSPLIKDSAYFTYAYCYMRHLDDTIDDPKLSGTTAFELLTDQTQKVIAAYEGKKMHPADEYEAMLFAFIRYDVGNGRVLKEALMKMFDSFYFDVTRINRVVPRAELEEYSQKMGNSFVQFLSHFLHPGGQYSMEVVKIASAACQIYMLRDLEEDLRRGYVNIDCESINEFSIDIKKMKSDNVRYWIQRRVAELESKISQLINAAICENRVSFRERLVLLLFLEPRRYVLTKFRRNGFRPLHQYKLNLLDYLGLVARLAFQILRLTCA